MDKDDDRLTEDRPETIRTTEDEKRRRRGRRGEPGGGRGGGMKTYSGDQ